MQQSSKDLHLAFHEATGSRRHLGWRTNNRRLCAMRTPKRVVDEVRVPIAEFVDPGLLGRLLARVEAHVLEHGDVREHLGQHGRDGRHGVALIGCALRPPEVRAHTHLCTLLHQPRQRRKRRANSEVIDDDPSALNFGDGHVEVRSNEDPRPTEITEIFEERETSERCRARRAGHLPRRMVRSTRRFE